MKTPLKLGLIGLGHLGTRHLKVLRELKDKVQIIALCDSNTDKAKPIAAEHNISLVDDYKKLLGQVDAVDICTPTITHCEIAKFFLHNNVHAFVEKPMTFTLEEADVLVALAEKHNLKLQVGHVERFNSAFVAVSKMASDPLFIECHRLNLFPNRSLDIGVVMDLMIHDIDIICGLIQKPIKDIQAVGVNVLTDREDIANARVTFDNGSVCNLTASRVSPDVMRKIRIFLKNAYISLDYVAQEAFIYRKDGLKITKQLLPIEKEEPLKAELESFVDCVRENRNPIVSGREGREALRVALEITHKIWSNPRNAS